MTPTALSQSYLWIPALLAVLLALAALLISLANLRKQRDRETGSNDLSRRLEKIDKISNRLDELRTIFVTPHIRGGVGETMLEELIRNWLPPDSYEFQYGFRSGARADAVIRLGSYLVAVDSKFPLESVQELFGSEEEEGEGGNNPEELRNETEAKETSIPAKVKRTLISHAEAISSRYIHPDEGTLQFALMYIPSEAVYYRCFVRESSLADTLISMHVIPTGPYTLFLYVQTVAYGLRGFAFPQRTRELAELSYKLESELQALTKELSTASTHLKNLTGSLDAAVKRNRRLESISEKIAGVGHRED